MILFDQKNGGYQTPYASNSYLASQTSSFIGGHGASLQEAYLTFKQKYVNFSVGKFNPIFLSGYNRYSSFFDNDWYGVYGTFINRGYQMTDKLGLNLEINIIDTIRHKVFIRGYLFKNDESNLFTNPSITSTTISGFLTPQMTGYPSQRVAGENSGLKSNVISVEGSLTSKDYGILRYNMSYRRQSVNDARSNAFTDETGYGTSLQYVQRFFNSVKILGFTEYAKIQNAAGIRDFDENYITAAISGSIIGWHAGYILNIYDSTGSSNGFYLRSQESNIGYEFDSYNLGIYLAKRSLVNNTGGESDTLGASVRYIIDMGNSR
jgi:hypothetical protein